MGNSFSFSRALAYVRRLLGLAANVRGLPQGGPKDTLQQASVRGSASYFSSKGVEGAMLYWDAADAPPASQSLTSECEDRIAPVGVRLPASFFLPSLPKG